MSGTIDQDASTASRPTVGPAHPVSSEEKAENRAVSPRLLGGLEWLGSAIKWLGGSLAGLGAISYAFGYIATLANLDMLGLDPLALHYDANFLIQRGGVLFFLLAQYIIQGSFWFILIAAIGLVLTFYATRLFPPLGRAAARIRSALGPKVRFTSGLLGYVALVILLFIQTGNHLSYPDVLRISNVLYGGQATGPEATTVLRWIELGERQKIQALFVFFVQQHAFIGLFLVLAWFASRSLPWRGALLLPFFFVFVISFAWVPFEYGKLMLPGGFAETHITLLTEDTALSQGSLFLLNKTDEAVILWQAVSKRVLWIPSSKVSSLEIGQNQPLSVVLQASSGTLLNSR